MKFDLQKAIDGHPLELNGEPIYLRAVRFESGEPRIYVSRCEGELPSIFKRDGTPDEAGGFHLLTLAEPEREVHLVLYPGNEARYFHTLEAAQAAARGTKGVGPFTVLAKLPWEVSVPTASRVSLKA